MAGAEILLSKGKLTPLKLEDIVRHNSWPGADNQAELIKPLLGMGISL